MGHIVAILGSPRKDGNSSTIAYSAVDGAMGLSTNLIDIHELNQLNCVRGCQACEKCKQAGICVVRDDLSKTLADVKAADAVIVAVPLYFGHASSQYRQFEDRLYGFIDAKGKSVLPEGKKLIVIVTYGGAKDQAEKVADDIETVFVRCFKCRPCGRIIYQGNDKDQAKNDPKVLKEARDLGFALWKD